MPLSSLHFGKAEFRHACVGLAEFVSMPLSSLHFGKYLFVQT